MCGPRARAYLSFDYAHDLPQKNVLLAQSLQHDSPIAIQNWSVPGDDDVATDWRTRELIRQSDVVIVLCGRYTHVADEVAREVQIAREEAVRCCLLRGYRGWRVRRPRGTSWFADRLYPWTPIAMQIIAREPTWWAAGW